MRKSLRIMVMLVLAVFVFTMASSAITILGGSTEEKLKKTDWTDAGTMGFSIALDEPIDISNMENLYLRFYLDSVDNCYSASNGELELTSGGTCDVEESKINPLFLDWEDGWNEFVIPLDEFAGDCDFTRMDYVRLYMFTDGMNCSVLDYVAVGNSSDDQSVLVKTNWEIPAKPSEDEAKPDIVTTSAVGKGNPWTAVLDNAWGVPIDISAYESAYIGFYVSDIDAFASHIEGGNGGQIEFGSKYVPDAEEDDIPVSSVLHESGWTYIEVPLTGSNCDYTRFNHFRIYIHFESPDEEIEVKLDYLAFGDSDMEVGEGKASSFPLVLIKPLAEREAEEAAAAAEEAAAAEAAGDNAEESAGETPSSGTEGETKPTTAPPTADFGIAASAVLFAAACVTIGLLKKKK